ncbi:MAG: tRNA (uridine(34)/cytosine(34)/5-carboxymethylaminomethyluridine(34)-2'-O)-methyltransferase TrmL [Chromatiales bacterium 21-64-14]|nr:MAG: tRNA (uridine(34)/cytosine(34)/5-carboxymethylaminomethyluridine(34)-2'-O)-methyltransferase TrmL [Chromatiales bacterium 21-64-14]HQU14550.1 tRNA (cytidine(34)-2'-O)-methyltransferase [Gammaproteobacteria bacterium]
MFHVVLYQPEIPPNTGNIIRLCVNAGAALHLIRPLGFDLSDRRLRRAGLDYREWAAIEEYADLSTFQARVAPRRIFACSTRGGRSYTRVQYETGDALLFGPETRGLPGPVLEQFAPDHTLRIPMVPGSRSLNLSNAVAVVLFEAWRQTGFAGCAPAGG